MNGDKQILFVCTGNTCRSPMAAALFNQYAADGDWQASSAGIAAAPDQPASCAAVRTMQDLYQINLDGHRSSPINMSDPDNARWILTMTAQQRDFLRMQFPRLRERIYTVSEFAGETEWDIADPFGQELACYQETALQLADLIGKIWRKLTDSAI